MTDEQIAELRRRFDHGGEWEAYAVPALCDDVAALRAENARLTAQLVDERGRHQEFERELLARAKVEDARLRAHVAALVKYACHKQGCVAYHYGGCDCGLKALTDAPDLAAHEQDRT